ncbi:MAG: DUF2062 domain-containing protein [bacterium]
MRQTNKLKTIFSNKYVTPVKNLLMQGTSPKLLAIGIAGALVIGLFPVLGSTTLLCTIFAFAFRLNLPLIQLVNFSVYPLQLILIIPFMKMGDLIFGYEKMSYGFNDIIKLISNDTLHAINILWYVTIQAIGVWFLFAPVVSLIFYYILLSVIKSAKIKLLSKGIMKENV